MSELLLKTIRQIDGTNEFDYCQALYWYCVDNHDGQFSDLYSILSQLQYNPATTETAGNCVVTIETTYHAECVWLAFQVRDMVEAIPDYATEVWGATIVDIPNRDCLYLLEVIRSTGKSYRVLRFDTLTVSDVTDY